MDAFTIAYRYLNAPWRNLSDGVKVATMLYRESMSPSKAVSEEAMRLYHKVQAVMREIRKESVKAPRNAPAVAFFKATAIDAETGEEKCVEDPVKCPEGMSDEDKARMRSEYAHRCVFREEEEETPAASKAVTSESVVEEKAEGVKAAADAVTSEGVVEEKTEEIKSIRRARKKRDMSTPM